LYRPPAKKRTWKAGLGALEMVGLGRPLITIVAALPAGTPQRVAICHGVLKTPRSFLAEEPTGQLDSQDSVEVMEISRSSNDARGDGDPGHYEHDTGP